MKKLSKNILLFFTSEGGSRLFGFLTTIYLARFLSVNEFGIINVGLTVFAYALIFGSQWLNMFGTSMIAQGANSNFIGKFVALRFILSVVLFLIILFILYLFINDSTTSILIILFVLTIFPNIFLLDWFYLGKTELLLPSVSRLLITGGYFISVLVLFQFYANPIVVPVSFFTGNTIGVVFLLYRFRKDITVLFANWSFKDSFLLLKKSFNLSSATVIAQLNVNLPIIIIGLLLTSTEAGIYSAASRLVFFLLIIDKLFYTMYFPTITNIFKENEEKLPEIISFVLRLTLMCIIPITFLGILLSEPIINVIYGAKYKDSVMVIQLLIGYFSVTILNSIYGYGLVAIKKEKYYSRIIAFSFFIYIIFIVLFTYLFGVTGTAAAVVFSEFIVLISFAVLFNKFVPLKQFSYLLKMFPAIIAVIVIIYFTYTNLIISVLFATISYFLVILLTNSFTKSDLKILKEKFL